MNQSEPEPNHTSATQGAAVNPRAVVSVIGWLLVGLSLIALGAATVFSFLRQLRGAEHAPALDWLISIGMVGLFGLLPIVVGVIIVFRAVPARPPENSTVK